MKARYVLLGLALLAALTLAQPTITLSPKTVPVGGTLTITIRGVGAEKCGIEVVDPAGMKVFVKEITLSAGVGSAVWDVPLTARLGIYTVYVSCQVSGAASDTLTVTALVGGKAYKDYTPLLLAALAGVAVAIAAAFIAREFVY